MKTLRLILALAIIALFVSGCTIREYPPLAHRMDNLLQR